MLLMLLLLLAVPAAAQPGVSDWPNRDIRIIVPFPPGDAADEEARRLGAHFAEIFGVSVVVDNRAGVSGRMGVDLAHRSAPDGYTLTMGASGPLTLLPQMMGANYDPVSSFAPVLLTAVMPLLLVTPEGPAYARVHDLVLRARGIRGGLNGCSPGIATPSHIAVLLFARALDIEVLHVPYRGAHAALTDVITARCDLMFENAASAGRHVRAGRLQAVGITADAPADAWPGVPALQGVRLHTWTALIAPHGTHPLIVAQLNDAGRRFAARPEQRERILREGGRPMDLAPSEVRSFMRREVEMWRAILRDLDLWRG